MPAIEASGHIPHPSPVVEICYAMEAAEDGIMPSFSPESLLRDMRLDGPEPDGRPLIARFIGNTARIKGFRALLSLEGYADELIVATNERTANPAQEAIAQALGSVVTRQIMREGDVCPLVASIAFKSMREDIIPIEAKRKAFLQLAAETKPKRRRNAAQGPAWSLEEQEIPAAGIALPMGPVVAHDPPAGKTLIPRHGICC